MTIGRVLRQNHALRETTRYVNFYRDSAVIPVDSRHGYRLTQIRYNLPIPAATRPEHSNHRDFHLVVARHGRAQDARNGHNPDDCETWIANARTRTQFHILSVDGIS